MKVAWSRIGTVIALAVPLTCSLSPLPEGDGGEGGEAGAEAGARNDGGKTSRGGAPPKPGTPQGGEGGDAGEANAGLGGNGDAPSAGTAGAAGSPVAGTAGASGAAVGCNSPNAECEAAKVENEPRACGACNAGTQTRTRTCSADCRWSAWSAFGACNENAVECKPDHWHCCAPGAWMWCRASTCEWTGDCDATSCAASADCEC